MILKDIIVEVETGVEANICSLLPGVSCKPNHVRQIVSLQVQENNNNK